MKYPAYLTPLKLKLRRARFKFFLFLLQSIKSENPIEILDIGGTEIFWETMNFDSTANDIKITLLNLEEVQTKSRNFKSIKGNACDLSMFRENEFDIVFSNSVIEHLFSLENQIKMANEVRRVGKFYYVQTPNYFFPIEPHWFFPCFQYLPVKIRVFLTKNFDLGHYKKSKNTDEAIKRVNEVKLLTEKQMKQIYPEGEVYREMFFGLVKSITLYHFPKKVQFVDMN